MPDEKNEATEVLRAKSPKHREIDLCFWLNQPKSDYVYHFTIDLEPKVIQFGIRWIEND